MKHIRKIPVGITVLVLFLAAVVFGASAEDFRRTNEEAILERNEAFLAEHTVHHAAMVSELLKDRLHCAENAGILLGGVSQDGEETIVKNMKSISSNTYFQQLYFVTAEAVCYGTDGEKTEFQNKGVLQRGLQGESGIDSFNDAWGGETKQIICYAPVLGDDGVRGVVIGSSDYADFSQLFEMASGEEKYTFSYLTDKNGKIILGDRKSLTDTVFDFLEERMESEDYNNFVAGIEQSGIGYARYRGDHGEGLVCFSSLEVNDWRLIHFINSEEMAQMSSQLRASAYRMEVAMGIGMLLVLAAVLLMIFRRFNQKRRLTELALEALGDSFPQLAFIEVKTGESIFLKGRENKATEQFRKSTWEEHLAIALPEIHSEDRVKCKSFSSIENMRRVIEQGLIGDTCIYRRRTDGEYQWLQTTIIPVRNAENYVLLYSRTVHETLIAEESYKHRLWEELQKSKRVEKEKIELLRYISGELKLPMTAIREAVRQIQKVQEADYTEAEHYLNRIENEREYTMAVLEDIVQIGVMQNRQVIVSERPFSVQRMLDTLKDYHGKKQVRGITLKGVQCDTRLRQQYNGDAARIQQVLSALLENMFRFASNGGEVSLYARLEETEEGADRISFFAQAVGRSLEAKLLNSLKKFLENAEEGFEKMDTRIGAALVLAKLEAAALDGEIKVENIEGGFGFTLYLSLRHTEV